MRLGMPVLVLHGRCRRALAAVEAWCDGCRGLPRAQHEVGQKDFRALHSQLVQEGFQLGKQLELR
jgi:hypothetical protein